MPQHARPQKTTHSTALPTSDNKIQHVVQLHVGRCPERVGGGNEGVVTTSGDTGCCSLGGRVQIVTQEAGRTQVSCQGCLR